MPISVRFEPHFAHNERRRSWIAGISARGAQTARGALHAEGYRNQRCSLGNDHLLWRADGQLASVSFLI